MLHPNQSVGVFDSGLGGLTVLSGLHPAMVGSHFVLSLAAVGGALLAQPCRMTRATPAKTWATPRVTAVFDFTGAV